MTSDGERQKSTDKVKTQPHWSTFEILLDLQVARGTGCKAPNLHAKQQWNQGLHAGPRDQHIFLVALPYSTEMNEQRA